MKLADILVTTLPREGDGIGAAREGEGYAVVRTRGAYGDFGCCETCAHAGSAECDSCDSADLYEPDLDAIEELIEDAACPE